MSPVSILYNYTRVYLCPRYRHDTRVNVGDSTFDLTLTIDVLPSISAHIAALNRSPASIVNDAVDKQARIQGGSPGARPLIFGRERFLKIFIIYYRVSKILIAYSTKLFWASLNRFCLYALYN